MSRVGRVLVLATLVAIVACGVDSGSTQTMAADGAMLAVAPSTPDEATGSSDAMTPALRAAYIAAVQRNAGPEYALASTAYGAAVRGVNAAHGLNVEVSRDGLVAASRANDAAAWRLGLRWTGLGRGTAIDPVPDARSVDVTDNRATLVRFGGLEEWYLNGPLGIEQGFVLAERPVGGAGDVVIEVTVGDSLTPELSADGAEVSLRTADGNRALRYGELFAHDADGDTLDARLEVDSATILLIIDDAGASYPVTVDPLIEQEKLSASDGAAGDAFGYSVSTSGDTAIIGAGNGAAYVFVRSGSVWTEQQKLQASDGAPEDLFGLSVSVSGDTAIIGAKGDADNGSRSGSAYVFVRTGSVWTEQQKLLPSDGAVDEGFGISVSSSGDTLLVGAHWDGTNGVASGAACVFARTGGVWTEQQKLLASNGAQEQNFGWSVSLDGDTALVGAHGDLSWYAPGSAYVFVRNGSVWTEQQQFSASDGASEDWFGISVSLDGDVALVGAPRLGAAYVFVRSGSVWTQEQKLVASDAPTDNDVGSSVSLDGAAALVGDTRNIAAYVFAREGSMWTERQKLSPSDGAVNAEFGLALSLIGDTAIVGAPFHNDNGANSGVAYVFVFRFDGEACTDDTVCATACVDGYCCDSACTDPCQACNVGGLEGSCSLVPLGEDPDGDCPDGHYCDGAGSCIDSSDSGANGVECTDASLCASGYCVDEVCCAEESCAAYRCGPGGICLPNCTSASDCAAGFQCDAAGACVAPAPAASEDSGCNCSLPGRSPRNHAWLVLLLAATFAARRRRRRAA